MIVTTTDYITNQIIASYLGVISGADIYLVGGALGGGLVNQDSLYSGAFNNAMNKMISRAKSIGADAVVGVSTNITSPGGMNNIIVTVSGTAVKTIKTSNSAYNDELPDL